MVIVRDHDVEALFGDDLRGRLAVVRASVAPLPTGSTGHPLPDRHQMSPRRVATFLAGRAAARQALSILGHPSSIIPIGVGGNPIWPAGFAGSITHTDTVAYAVAISTADPETADPGTAATRADVAATGATEMVSVGLDVEHRRQIDAELVSTIMTPREHARWAALEGEAADRFATMVFTAKEALYKAQFPLTGAWLGFEHIEALGFGAQQQPILETAALPSPAGIDRIDITLTETSSSPLDPTIDRPLRVACLVDDDQVISAVALRRTTSRARSR